MQFYKCTVFICVAIKESEICSNGFCLTHIIQINNVFYVEFNIKFTQLHNF